MRGRARGSLRRSIAACLIIAVLLYFSARAVDGPAVRAATAPVPHPVTIVLAVLALGVSALSAEFGYLRLPAKAPGIKIEDFNVVTPPPPDFNVGDHGTVNLKFGVSYGGLDDKLRFGSQHIGYHHVDIFVDGNLVQSESQFQEGGKVKS